MARTHTHRLSILTALACISLSLLACVEDQADAVDLSTTEGASRGDSPDRDATEGDAPDDERGTPPERDDERGAPPERGDAPDRDADRERPEGDEAPSCEDRCQDLGRRAFARCSEAGGSRHRCARVAHAVTRRCATARCQDGAECEDRCIEGARVAAGQCVEAGHDPEACRERAHQGADACIAERCGPSDRPAPDDTDRPAPDDSDAPGDRPEPGDRPAPDDTDRPAPGDRPEPPASCEDDCGLRARHLLAECVADGHAEADCAARARGFHGQCVDRCEDAPPVPGARD